MNYIVMLNCLFAYGKPVFVLTFLLVLIILELSHKCRCLGFTIFEVVNNMYLLNVNISYITNMLSAYL